MPHLRSEGVNQGVKQPCNPPPPQPGEIRYPGRLHHPRYPTELRGGRVRPVRGLRQRHQLLVLRRARVCGAGHVPGVPPRDGSQVRVQPSAEGTYLGVPQQQVCCRCASAEGRRTTIRVSSTGAALSRRATRVPWRLVTTGWRAHTRIRLLTLFFQTRRALSDVLRRFRCPARPSPP